MNDILIFGFGALLGFLLTRGKTVVKDDTLELKVQELQESVAYYKDLCKWHVEEKAKLQELKDKFERECG
jgi:hypothetical protein